MFTSDHEAPLLQDNIETPKRRTLIINETESKTDEIYDLHGYIQSLTTEVETMKLLMKEELYLLKKSISQINSNTDATENGITETTDFFPKENEFLLQENASKNTIIKILAENQEHTNNTKEIDSSDSFKTVKGTFKKIAASQKHRTLSAAFDMILFTQQMKVRNQIPLVMQKLCF